jgi:hypothetical protein
VRDTERDPEDPSEPLYNPSFIIGILMQLFAFYLPRHKATLIPAPLAAPTYPLKHVGQPLSSHKM